MAAANASARGQRAAILASPLAELTGFVLVVDWPMRRRTVRIARGAGSLLHPRHDGG